MLPEHWPVLASTKLLNALPTEAAVVDRDGKIVFVNRTWCEFCESNAGPADQCLAGADYLKTCQDAAQRGDKIAGQVAAGLADVLEGTIPHFSCEYPCHAPHKQRWFHLLISPLFPDYAGAVLMHLDITERVKAELRVEAEARGEALLRSLADERDELNRKELAAAQAVEKAHDQPHSVDASYESLLQEALATHSFGDAAPVAKSCGLLAKRLARLQTTRAELVRLHTRVVATVERSIGGSRGQLLHSEGRMILLRVLADLASHYRLRALGQDTAEAKA